MSAVMSLLVAMGALAQNTLTYVPDATIEKRVEQTLGRMTLEEKVGQMTELAIDVLGHREGERFVLDQDPECRLTDARVVAADHPHH